MSAVLSSRIPRELARIGVIFALSMGVIGGLYVAAPDPALGRLYLDVLPPILELGIAGLLFVGARAFRPVSAARTSAWIIIGSVIFFGSIVATVTTYFMRPLQRPVRRIVDTIEFNLEQLDELTVEELEVLKETTTTLIEHMEGLRRRRESSDG